MNKKNTPGWFFSLRLNFIPCRVKKFIFFAHHTTRCLFMWNVNMLQGKKFFRLIHLSKSRCYENTSWSGINVNSLDPYLLSMYKRNFCINFVTHLIIPGRHVTNKIHNCFLVTYLQPSSSLYAGEKSVIRKQSCVSDLGKSLNYHNIIISY